MLKRIEDHLLDRLVAAAKASPRRRRNHDFHRWEEPVQRLLNALEPDTYIRPHRHQNPDKVEVFLCLRGRVAVLTFDEEGRLAETCVLSPGGPAHGAEVPPRTWHALVALEPGSAIFEVKEGPYDPATDKEFASWAPAEGTPEAALYLEQLRAAVIGDR
jgi:cupin fold WbuC family metalloprotein